MKTYLPSLKNLFPKIAFIGLFSVLAFWILFCLNIVYAAGYPFVKIKGGHIAAASPKRNTVLKKPDLAVPSVTYGSSIDYVAGVAIAPIVPVSSGVAALGYSANASVLGSGFTSPAGIAIDKSGNILVADAADGTIKRIAAVGGTTTTISSGFAHPAALALDTAGNIYIADAGSSALYEIIKATNVKTTIASGIGIFDGPVGLAIDAAGTLYVADHINSKIYKLAPGGTPVSIGTGFYNPYGVAVDKAGNVFVADRNSGNIKEIHAVGGTTTDYATGFNNPQSVAIDGLGNLYVGDYSNNAIKMIPAGGGTPFAIGTGFTTPWGVVADAFSGNVFVADYGNSLVKKIQPVGGYFIAPALPAGLTFNNSTGVISGTPTSVSPLTTYTVTAYNSTGSTTALIKLDILPLSFAYPSGAQIYLAGVLTNPLSPTSVGVAAPAYSATAVTIPAPGLAGPNTIAINAAGDMYVSDGGNSTVKKFPADGSAPVTIVSSVNTSGLALDGGGNLYVIDYANNAIKKYPAGIGPPQTVIAGLNQPFGIALDGNGNLFVADKGSGWVKKITPGAAFTTNYGSNYGPPLCVATDAAGNVYIGSANSPIKMIPAGGDVTISLGVTFTNPVGIVVDAAGNIFVSDQSNGAPGSGTIKEILASDVSTIVLTTGLSNQQGITLDSKGELFIADYNTHSIKQLTPQGGYFINAIPAGLKFNNTTGVITGTPTAVLPQTDFTVTAYNSMGSNLAKVSIGVIDPIHPTISYANVPSLVVNTTITPLTPTIKANGVIYDIGYNKTPEVVAATLNRPNSIATDAAGNIYVTNTGNSSVQKNPAGGGTPTFINGGFINPGGVAVDAAGNVYVGDYSNNVVKKVPGGTGTPIIIGSGFSGPTGVAVDAAGNVYVADFNNSAVKEILASDGTTITLGSGFNHPNGVAVDAAGNVYVADTFNNAVKKIPAGNGTVVSLATGLQGPYGVAVDITGNVFVAERDANAIDEIPVGGGARFTVGSNLSAPYGVAVDASGNLFVADFYNNAAKEIKLVGGFYINPALPPGLNFDRGTGIISGKPTVLSANANYTVTGFNYGGSGSTTIKVGVFAFGTPAFSYPSPKTYVQNVAIASLAPAALSGSGPIGALGYSSTTTTYGTGFSLPTNVAIDPAGNIYVADRGNNLVKKILASDGSTVVIGSGFNSPAGIALDEIGNVYVGDQGSNSIKVIPTGGGATFVLTSNGLSSPFGVAVNAAGDVYVADEGNNAIKKIPFGSDVPVVVGSGFTSPVDVKLDAAGNIYVADLGNNAVKKIPVGGGAIVTIGSGYNQPSSVAVDASGNVYVCDNQNSAIKEIPVGSNTPVSIGSGFNRPFGVTTDGAGNVIVADYLTSTIKKITPTGGYYIDALPAGLSFNNTTGVITGTPTVIGPETNYTVTAYNATGSGAAVVNITIGSALSSPDISYTTPNTFSVGTTITPLSPTNIGTPVPGQFYSQVTTLAGSGAAGSTNGAPASATFENIWGMATDAAGNVYAADLTSNLIRKIIPSGVVTTFAGSGAAGSTNSTGTLASFKSPSGVAVDASGNVFIADAGNNMIRKITPAQVVTTFAGSTAAGSANGTGTAATFHAPRGMVFDSHGNLFVADYSNNLIRKITPAGVVTTFAGSGTAGAVNGTGAAASFSAPAAITVDASNNLYVADYGNNMIRKITSGGVVTTFAGSTTAGNADGTGAAAGFKTPFGITSDAEGNLYVADRGNSLIRKITPGAVVTTLAGTGATGSVNGTGTGASFNDPRSVATDGKGNMYVGDYGGHQVRKVILTGYTISPALPAGLLFEVFSGIISGTPTAVHAPTNYTVTGYAANSSGTTTVNIAVTVLAPSISYTTPNTFAAGMPVTLSPTNNGTAIPATTYSQVTTLAGSGTSGSTNGTGAAATFVNLWGMATDATGNIYATDLTSNLIRKVTPAGVVTTFAGSGTAGSTNGTGTAASFKSPSGVAVDGNGNIFIADAGNNMIRKITPAGVVTTFAGNAAAGSANGTGTAATFHAPRGMVFDSNGNLFVADYSNNLIRKITPAGMVTTLAGSGTAGAVNGTGAAASFSAPAALAVDVADNLYVADYGNNMIRKITPGGIVTTFAGSTTAGNTNGTGAAASFKTPFGITSDAEGNLYVADRGNSLIRKITPAGVVTTLSGTGATGSVNGIGIAASFNDPRSVAIDGKGNMYVGDYGGHQVRKVVLTGYTIIPVLPAGLSFAVTTGVITGTPTTAHTATTYSVTGYAANSSNTTTVSIAVSAPAPNISYTTPNIFKVGTAASLTPMNSGSAIPATIYSQVTTLAGSGTAGAANGTGLAASFNNPWGMATDASGNIYVADLTGNLIRKVTPAGVVTTFAGSGAAGSANGTGTAATFKSPSGIAVDASGNVYVADAGNNMIREITPGGVVTTFAGSTAAGNTNGTGTAAKFKSPRGMEFDGSGNLYVADYSNDLIRKITPGGVVTTLAGSGTAGAVNGTGTAASFSSPAALTVDGSGNVYVADYGNNMIRKITPAGVVTTFAGSGTAGAADGTGAAASFKTPFGITSDPSGNLYVADRGNVRIRKITPAAVVTTLAGAGTTGSANGTGIAAQFNDPRSLATDASGNLYVGDFGGNQIRKILLTGYTITPALSAGLSFAVTTGIINGTPTATSTAKNYTVTGYSALGASTAVVNITVNAMGSMAAMIAETPLDSVMNAPAVKQGLSPNGDGLNDVMIISNIEKYPENKVTIINTAGVEIYQATGYDNQNKVFDGRSSKTRALQKPGTYFYRLEYNDNGKLKYRTGYILLKY